MGQWRRLFFADLVSASNRPQSANTLATIRPRNSLHTRIPHTSSGRPSALADSRLRPSPASRP